MKAELFFSFYAYEREQTNNLTNFKFPSPQKFVSLNSPKNHCNHDLTCSHAAALVLSFVVPPSQRHGIFPQLFLALVNCSVVEWHFFSERERKVLVARDKSGKSSRLSVVRSDSMSLAFLLGNINFGSSATAIWEFDSGMGRVEMGESCVNYEYSTLKIKFDWHSDVGLRMSGDWRTWTLEWKIVIQW